MTLPTANIVFSGFTAPADYVPSRHLFDGGRGVCHDLAAGGHRAREGDLCHVWVRTEQVARLALALRACASGQRVSLASGGVYSEKTKALGMSR